MKQIHEQVFGVNGTMESASSGGQESSLGHESTMGQESSMGQESHVGHALAQESDRFKFTAAGPATKSGQLEVNTLPFQVRTVRAMMA